MACENVARGFGGFIWLKYCNPKMDELPLNGLNTVDDKQRKKLLQDAVAIGVKDAATIPIHQQVTTWAAKKGISIAARTDERTHAYEFIPK